MNEQIVINACLKWESWVNLFDSIRDKDTKINSKGNFWAAIQRLEEQIGIEYKPAAELDPEEGEANGR